MDFHEFAVILDIFPRKLICPLKNHGWKMLEDFLFFVYQYTETMIYDICVCIYTYIYRFLVVYVHKHNLYLYTCIYLYTCRYVFLMCNPSTQSQYEEKGTESLQEVWHSGFGQQQAWTTPTIRSPCFAGGEAICSA